jgi:hypothetical protein
MGPAQEGSFRDITVREAALCPIIFPHYIRELALSNASEQFPQPLASAYFANDT